MREADNPGYFVLRALERSPVVCGVRNPKALVDCPFDQHIWIDRKDSPPGATQLLHDVIHTLSTLWFINNNGTKDELRRAVFKACGKDSK